MINIKHVDILKAVAQLEVELVSGGIMFLFIEKRTIKWKVASKKFDMDIFKEGADIAENAIAVRSMKEGKVLNEKVPREKYGRRLTTVAVPLVNDLNIPVGAF